MGAYQAGGTAPFYDAYGEFEWHRLEARAYGRLQAVIHADFLREYVRPGQRVLDAGCGPGRFTIELARLGARPVALDTSRLQLEAARRHAEEAGVSEAVEAFVEGDIVDLSRFEDCSFDAVVCFGGPLSYVLDHRQRAADELVRVTQPGGHVLVSAMSRLGATCNLVRRAAAEILRDPVAGKIRAVLDAGDLWDIPSRLPDQLHPDMHLYTGDELAALFGSCEIVAVAGSNVTATEADPSFDELVAAEPSTWDTVVEIERRLCRAPGLVDSGSHVIVVARKPVNASGPPAVDDTTHALSTVERHPPAGRDGPPAADRVHRAQPATRLGQLAQPAGASTRTSRPTSSPPVPAPPDGAPAQPRRHCHTSATQPDRLSR